MQIHMRPSTWLAFVTTIFVAFIALPAQHNYEIFGIYVVLQIAVICCARYEGRHHNRKGNSNP